jgi:hypothetical protein
MELWQRLIIERYNTLYLEIGRTLEPQPQPTWKQFMEKLSLELINPKEANK